MATTIQSASPAKSPPSVTRRWWAPLLLVVAGVLLTVLATTLYNNFDSGLPIDGLTELAEKAAAEGNDARYLLLTDLLGFLPSIVLVISGLLLTMRRAPDLPGWFRKSSWLMLAILGLATCAYVSQIALHFLLLGTIDLGSEFTLSESVHSAWNSSTMIMDALLAITVLGTLVHLIVSLVLLVIRLTRRTP